MFEASSLQCKIINNNNNNNNLDFNKQTNKMFQVRSHSFYEYLLDEKQIEKSSSFFLKFFVFFFFQN